MSQFIKFYFTSMLNMFWTLIRPSSGAYDFSIVSPHGYHPNQLHRNSQHTSKQEHTTNVVIQYKSRRLLMMDVLMSEACLSIEEVK